MTEAQQLREAILAASLDTSNFGETPRPGDLYIPPSHMKALRPDAHIVVGGRGVGKSFWTAVLQSDQLRPLVESAPALSGVSVRLGFASAENVVDYPNADVFSKFLNNDGDPYDLWRAVMLRWVAERSDQRIPRQKWEATVAWLKSDPEAAARLMQGSRDWRGLILFDALDRTSHDWQRMDQIVGGLLRAVLWLKPFPGLYAKVFLREDQAERTVFNFPDASKLTATTAELTWARHDLHGLLWQRLINAPSPHGELLRAICPHTADQAGVWRVADEMKTESEEQRKAFARLAGLSMGRDRRRGVPYTWAVSHLADGKGQTSPRSFLAAIRQAAEDSVERYASYEHALHYESIKRGIQKASEIRVQEMAEDYPWVPEVLSKLKGMNVPCEFDEVTKRWENAFEKPEKIPSSSRLPARHAQRGWEGLREDLERLGLIETKRDGRIDMPDLYRVGFGLGRKGGVKPRN